MTAQEILRPESYQLSAKHNGGSYIFDRVVPLILLAIILAFGSYVRLAALGVQEFSNDELDHYYGAQSLRDGRGPELPSGVEYRRGIDITRLVAISTARIEDPELAARLPTALFGITVLVLFAAIAWAIGGPWVAVWATLLLAIYPQAVHQSRHTRFYSYQLVFGLVALYAGWRMVALAGRKTLPSANELRSQWFYSGIAVIALLLATRVQVTTLSVIAGFGTAITAAAIADLNARGVSSWKRSVPLIVAVTGILFATIFIASSPGTVADLWSRAHSVPMWARISLGSPLSYYYALSDVFPVIISFAAVIFLVIALRNVMLSLYLGIWFGVPFLLHSFVFPWKGERFIFLAVPALLLAAALAAAWGSGALYRFFSDRLSVLPLSRRWAGVLAPLLLFAVLSAAVVTTPAFNQARKAPSGAVRVQDHSWRLLAERIAAERGALDIPVGTSDALSSLFYWGHADFTVLRGALEKPSGLDTMGAPDWYGGISALPTPEAIRERHGAAPFVLIGIDQPRWQFGSVEPSLKQVLESEAVELCRGQCGTMRLFRWTMREPDHD